MLFILLMICSGLVCLSGIWWTIVPLAFIAGMLSGKNWKHAFWSAFLANSLIWSVMILYRMVGSNTILIHKVSAMLFIPHWSILMLVTVFIGGLTSGSGGLAGFLTIRYIKNPKAAHK